MRATAIARHEKGLVRAVLAVLPPAIVLVIQLAMWRLFEPFAWFLFVPALFLSARIAGPNVAIPINAATTIAIWWFFVPPYGALGKDPRHYFPALVFFSTAVVFNAFHERLRRATRARSAALDEARRAQDEVSRLYRKAQELDALKSRFVATVSHELRTPLALVLGPLERLSRDGALDAPTRRELDGAARSARIVLRHVDDLLDVAKLDARRMEPSYADLDLAVLARLLVDPFSTLAKDRHIELTTQLPPSLRVEADPEQMRAVLTNLLSNALKFTPRDGRVRISLVEDPARHLVVLEVADSGPGIPAEHRDEAFERFHRIEPQGRRVGGTGLGLAIVRDFVVLHRGSITLHDATEGGVLARVELPRFAPPGTTLRAEHVASTVDADTARQLADEIRASEPGTPIVPSTGSGPLVLVVEDHPDMNRFMCESLPPGHRVATAYDGQQGLEAAIALLPDVIVVDVMMPEASGDELVRAVRAVPALERTAILVVTAKADDDLRVRLLRDGAQDFLVKPFVVEELRARVRNLTAAKRALDAESRLASLVEQAPDGIFVADLEGHYVEVNPAACRMLGYTREELLGKRIVDLLRPEDVLRLAESRERLLGGRIDDVGEWLLRRKDGTFVTVEVNARIPPDGRWQAVVRDVSERHRIEEELRQREADLHRAQALAKIGSWRIDAARGDIVWSDETHRIFGVPAGTVLDYGVFLSVVHPDDRAYVDRMWRATLDGAPYDIEHRLLVDGEVKWVRERADLVRDERGRILGGIGTTQDVTDRKRIELALQAAEQRAVESAARVRALSDAGAAINDAVARLPDASVESVMAVIAAQAQLLVRAMYVAMGVGTEHRAPLEHWIEVGTIPEHVSAEGRAVLRVPVRHRGSIVGDLFLAREHDAEAFTEDDERLVDLLASRAGAALEIARLYQKVAVSRAWMHTVVDQMPEGVLLLDAKGRIVADNRTLRAYAPASESAEDPFGNPVPLDLQLPSGRAIAPQEMPYVAAIERGEGFAGREYQVRRRDDSTAAVLVGVSPVVSDAGALTGAVMIVQDVSTLKELERLREEWTSVVAHDLRQPVNVITLAAGMLDEKRAPLPEDKRKWAIASIRRAAGTLDRMIGDLLDASRIEARRISVDRREVSLATLVRDVVDRVPGAGPRCDVDLAPGAERAVLADPVRIEQVLTNLLTNALKYGEPGARIAVRLLPRDRELEVIVTNRGPGIPPEEMPKIFGRFERTRAARAGRERGIGLGLYLSKGLIEAHDGRIWFESTPGELTSFHFTLPYAPRAEAEIAHA
ncbi:ATP-binding protein [Sandaracinus amylolyticus]|uniref:ATP-binding protein n=1 Tax=Sandaracinus amylolyticus TaxID=927083 RepID=UPI001F1AE34B|nr:ATP-binding protein [Sandaracinus amylolyticus]UJR83241.1 Hypothetical protein I5071_53080 [Sandaracinus amylolyticus]